jgi:hypothetical protein
VEAVVVMDNLPAHKMAFSAPMIQAVGASIINLYQFHKIVLQLINVWVMIYCQSKGDQMTVLCQD